MNTKTFVSLSVCVALLALCVATSSVSASLIAPPVPPASSTDSDETAAPVDDASLLVNGNDPILPPNCTGCNLPQLQTVFGREICNFPLFISWILAVTVGVVSGTLIIRKGPTVVGARSYAASFFTYAVMMTFGAAVHSFFLVECGVPLQPSQEFAYFIVSEADIILTSCIAVSFLFNGLIDARLVSENNVCTWFHMLGAYALVAAGYLFTDDFLFLYQGLIVICCGGFLLLQCTRVCSQWETDGWKYLIAAGIIGGGSLAVTTIPSLLCEMCQKLGGWSMQGVWYFGADISMALMCIYVLLSRTQTYGPDGTYVRTADSDDDAPVRGAVEMAAVHRPMTSSVWIGAEPRYSRVEFA